MTYLIIALEWASRIGGLATIALPVLWAIFPKAIETLLAKTRDKVLHAHSITLESHKGDVAVKTQISLKTYENQRKARADVRAMLSKIENAIRETYLAYYIAKRDEHPNDAENNHYRDQHAIHCRNGAVKLLREFRTMAKDLAGDLGDTTGQMCEWVGTEFTKWLASAEEGRYVIDPDLEEQRMAGDHLRQILAMNDQADSDRLLGKPDPEPF